MTPRGFFEFLWADKQEEHRLLLWTLQGKRTQTFTSLDEAAHAVDRAVRLEQDIYMGVGLGGRDCPPNERFKADEITAISAIPVDIDCLHPVHTKTKLPATIEEACSILPPEFLPSLIVKSGHGIQAWIKLKEPWVFESPEEREAAHQMIVDYQQIVRYAGLKHDWQIDMTHDLARVMRIPGTKNFKDRDDVRLVEIVEFFEDRAYNPSDLVEFTGSIFHRKAYPVGEFPPAETPTQKSAENSTPPPRPKVLGFHINLAASIPEELIKGWSEDPDFYLLWNQLREDMNDKTGSGYGMAIADWGVKYGLPLQQIVDLMVHARRKHGKKPRKNISYYQLTLGKALKLKQGTGKFPDGSPGEPPPPNEQSAGSKGEAPAPPNPQSPGTNRTENEAGTPSREARCTNFTKGLKLCPALVEVTRIGGSNPAYSLRFADGRTALAPDTKILLTQESLLTCVAKIGITWHSVPTKDWYSLRRELISAAVRVDVGPEADTAGSTLILIDKYLAQSRLLPNIEDGNGRALFGPVIRDGRIAISPVDLQDYSARCGEKMSPQAIAVGLLAIGAERRLCYYGPRGRHQQTRWLLPIENFAPEAYFKVQGTETGKPNGRAASAEDQNAEPGESAATSI